MQASISKYLGSNIFSSDEYGLLNTAKFAEVMWNRWDGNNNTTTITTTNVNDTTISAGQDVFLDEITTNVNTSFGNYTIDLEADVIAKSPSAYTLPALVIISVIITAMMIVIVVGNMLVVIAIATENNLTTVQNWFIASLAVADMLIGTVVMPFSLTYELMGYWMFGTIWCEVWAAMDVLLCTSSIMNICLISLDRYWSITKAISYLHQRTPSRVAFMIVMVWILSALISIPPLLGWKEEQDLDWFRKLLSEKENRTQMEFVKDLEESGRISLNNFTETLTQIVYPQCLLSSDTGYVMYSAFGSFYIPSCIMVFVYIKIYYAARERARRVINKPGFGKRISRRFAKNPTNTTISTTAAAAIVNSSAGAKSGGGPPAAASTKSNIVGQSCNNDTAASRNNLQHQIPTISTISNNNGAVHQQQLIGINSSANNSTIGAEPPEATAAVEACTVEASKSNTSNTTVVKKRARFDLDPTTTTPSENENLLPPASTNHEAAASGNGNVKIKKSVHILSATTASLTSTGRVSDPCEVTILDRPHAYGACAQNGGRQPKPPRTCRSIGVSTKDDQPVISNSITNSSSSSNRGCVPSSNGTSNTSSSAITQGLRSRLKMKFKSGVSGSSNTSCSRRRPSKETREVIDMGKVSAPGHNIVGNNLVCKKQNKFPLNGILRKKCATTTTDEYNNSVANNTTAGGCNSITNQQVSVGPNSTAGNSEGGTSTIPNNNPAMVVPKLTPEQEAEKQKKAMARKKERRATLILGLIMGSFIACWFPFFFLYSISPWCPICDGNNGPICVQGWGFTLAFWLGYSNSALNPVIYTVFNKDFRRAFKRILFK